MLGPHDALSEPIPESNPRKKDLRFLSLEKRAELYIKIARPNLGSTNLIR